MARIREIHESAWQPLNIGKLVAVTLLIAAVVFMARSEQHWVFILDSANLAFHEAGHPFFGFISERLMVYGGTLGQLAFPLAAWAIFWVRREAASCAVAAIWLFENFLNIARYMGDARAQELPLVGGGEHDWSEIFSRWGVLQSDTAIANFVSMLGWFGMLIAWAWLAWRTLQSAREKN